LTFYEIIKVYEKTFQAGGAKARIFSNACPNLLRLAEQGQITDTNRIEELARECVYPLEKEPRECSISRLERSTFVKTLHIGEKGLFSPHWSVRSFLVSPPKPNRI
jgi:hypothetical protein